VIIDSYVVHGAPTRVAVLGDLTFRMSPNHALVTNYTARIRAAGTSSPILSSVSLGVPQPDEDGIVTANLTSALNALGVGNYEVTVATTTAGGTTDSSASTPFSVPLA